MTPELLTPQQAAAYLAVSVRHLRRMAIQRMPLPGQGTGARPRIRYRKADLDAFVSKTMAVRQPPRRPAA